MRERRPRPPFPPSPPKRGGRFRFSFNVMVGALYATVVLIVPCFLLVHGYQRLAGRPITLWGLMGISLLWFLLVYLVLHALTHYFRKKWRPKERGPNMFDDVMDALDRIAGGDYDIVVKKEGRFHYSELADKVNNLARELKSMEQMRQEFVSNVSHEIQSPLTSIGGFAALLKKEDLPPERRLHYAEVIEAEARRLSKLSDNLLRLSVLDTEQPPLAVKPFRMDKQIEEILLMLEPQWSEKGIELEVALESVTLCGGEDLLSQVWINLLHNSIKFTPAGGKIAVTLEREDAYAVCSISDTGRGMTEESLLHIFERFYKVDKARDRSLGGNGLGLSLVKKIVDLHGGKITAKSKLGEGAAFTVRLPMNCAYKS